jgi:hypothetical protein
MELAECGAFCDDVTVPRVPLSLDTGYLLWLPFGEFRKQL